MSQAESANGAILKRLSWLPAGLRGLILLLCVFSLYGYSVLTAQSAPQGTLNSLLLATANAPKAIAATFGNLVRDRFADSRTPDIFANEPGFVPVVNHTHHRIEGLVMRRGAGALLDGRRMIYGIFTIDGRPQYAVMTLAPDLAVEHIQTIGDDVFEDPYFSVGQAPFPHGFSLLDDGSMLVMFDSGHLPVRLDACGRLIWSSDTYGTHSVNPTGDGKFAWSSDYDLIRLFDLADGRVVRQITFDDLRAANPELGLFDMRRIDDNALGANPASDAQRYFDDAYHLNDVEPLPAELAPAFPKFAVGDILFSARSLNLVMVVDPDTLKVKWFNNDFTLRQHDPDWGANGQISVLDNQSGSSFSRILEFDPVKGTHSVRVDGSAYGFYTRIRGKQQALPDGGILITSSQQGRVFELDPQGRVVFDILVRDPSTPNQNFAVSEANWYPTQSPALRKVLTCSASQSVSS